MSLLNELGDTLTVVINNQPGYGSSTINLIPPIIGMNYFRVLSNVICLISVDFSLTTYTIAEDGSISLDKSLIAGKPDTWYTCINKNIASTTITLIDPAKVPTQNVSLTFQFVRNIPDSLIQKF